MPLSIFSAAHLNAEHYARCIKPQIFLKVSLQSVLLVETYLKISAEQLVDWCCFIFVSVSAHVVVINANYLDPQSIFLFHIFYDVNCEWVFFIILFVCLFVFMLNSFCFPPGRLCWGLKTGIFYKSAFY